DGRIDNFIKEKYSSFESGIGKKIREKKTSLKELAEEAAKMKKPSDPGSGREEYLEGVVNNILFK
nr:xylose isomerase [Treponema sp.]